MPSFFSKFKFKWWSWERDALQLLSVYLIILAFLPVLPYEKKDGKLVSVLGFNASVENFYYIGLELLAKRKKEKEVDFKEGGSLDELLKFQQRPFPSCQ